MELWVEHYKLGEVKKNKNFEPTYRDLDLQKKSIEERMETEVNTN